MHTKNGFHSPRVRFATTLLLALSMPPTTVFGADKLEEIAVTATISEHNASTAPASVTVITQGEEK